MKRKVAPRKLKRRCIQCDKSFKKGDVYYLKRSVVDCGGNIGILAYEMLSCPKCKYHEDKHKERFEKFKPNCQHPIVNEVWDYIPGEFVMQPDHDECVICGEIVL